jgi:hypothetical protein
MRLARILAGFAIGCCPVAAQGIITTLAGTGFCNYSGDGGPAAAATLCSAGALAADAAGNVYFSDNLRIRRVSPDGIITTIAGSGVYGNSGDGGPALSATIGNVGQMAIRGSGLCFTQSTGYKIRCIDLSTGLIQGLGSGNMGTGGDGGNVSGASFLSPSGVAFDAAGNLYISDFSANSVRRVDAATGVITLFAGPGPGYCCVPVGDGGPAVGANLYEPEWIYYYGGGLYIADFGNNRIRRVDLATGIISTVAGSGSPYDPAGGADGGPALLAGIVARQIVLDPSGNLYINAGTSVRMVDGSGIITTIAGHNGISGGGSDDIPSTDTVFGGIGGLGWDAAAKRLLISDAGTRVRQIFYTPATTTSLTPSVNPVVPGGQVILDATVSPVTATGSVRFYAGPTLLGSTPLSNGVAEFTWTAPLGGYSSYTMRAVYGGDANDNLSAASVVESIQQGTTTTTLTSSANPSTQGQSVTFTVTVLPAAATGTVSLINGSTEIGTATLSNGTATFSVSNLALGSNSIYAWYHATPAYQSSISATLTQVVRAATTTSLSTGPNPSVYGGSVTLTATVSPAAATGPVQFFDGATLLGSANLAGGQAQLSLTSLPAGSDSLTAVYGGDTGYAGSTSAVVTQTVTKQASTVTLSSTANPSTLGQSIGLIATVSPSAATGTVQFLDGSIAVGVAPVHEGVANLSLSSLPPGDHSITAVYSGDANIAASTSSVLVQTVSKRSTSVTLTSSPNPAMEGQTVTLTAVVSPSDATGLVQFFEGSGLLGTVAVGGGSASLVLSPQIYAFPVGAHSITATYGGDANNASSTSAVLIQTIVKRAATSVGLSSSPNPSTVGQAVTFTARISPSSATGTVQFVDGAVVFATAVVSGGTASVTTSALAADTHSIFAVYSGDVNYAPSTSSQLTQAVSKMHTSVTLTSSPNPAREGQTVTLTAVVSPSDATGLVQFFEGSGLLGTVAVGGGSASLVLSPEIYAFPVGTHSIAATYGGDANHASSTSAVLRQTIVRKVATSVRLSSSPNPSTVGQAVTFTVRVSPSSATGTVQFVDGAVVFGTAAVSGGTASLTTSALVSDTHLIFAVYSGDVNYATSTSSQLTQTVLPGPPSGLTATAASSSRIDLSWNASPTSGVTYNVYSAARSDFTPSASNRIASGLTATSFSNSGLPASTTRYYRVTARNSAGESTPSNQASATTARRGPGAM